MTGLSSTVTSRVTVPRVSCQILSVYLPGGTLSRANSPLAPVTAKNGCSATTTQARIQVWRSQSIRTISGFLKATGTVRPLGWVRLKVAFSVLTLCRLWSSRSLLRNSTVPPTGTITTRGT